MKRYVLIVLFLSVFGFVQAISVHAQSSGSVSLRVTENRKIITRSINKNLLLRVVKDSSVEHKHFGWLVEVVRQPYRRGARNLIYTNPAGVGADPSQVYAWHIADDEFPNERKIKVRNHPYSIKISLIDCKIAGTGTDARFVAGTLRIGWTRQN